MDSSFSLWFVDSGRLLVDSSIIFYLKVLSGFVGARTRSNLRHSLPHSVSISIKTWANVLMMAGDNDEQPSLSTRVGVVEGEAWRA